jgi:hypothetical protein
MKLSARILILSAILTAPSCINQSQSSDRVSPTKASSCVRLPASYWNLPAELNRLDARCRAQPRCPGGFANVTTVTIAGYSSPWLWSGPSPSQVFTVAQQDAIIAQAQTKAQAALPAGKVIKNIEYFSDFLVSQGSGGYFIGARAHYANCLTASPT